jgi:uncharacterized low-complexity protein
MKHTILTSLALGSVLALSAGGIQAAENPFEAKSLKQGYQLAEGTTEEGKKCDGKCGEGKCGAEGKKCKDKEGKCGEGKCGEKKSEEGKCGGKKGEGACGHG